MAGTFSAPEIRKLLPQPATGSEATKSSVNNRRLFHPRRIETTECANSNAAPAAVVPWQFCQSGGIMQQRAAPKLTGIQIHRLCLGSTPSFYSGNPFRLCVFPLSPGTCDRSGTGRFRATIEHAVRESTLQL